MSTLFIETFNTVKSVLTESGFSLDNLSNKEILTTYTIFAKTKQNEFDTLSEKILEEFLIEKVTDVSSIDSAFSILVEHLLKWKYNPAKQSSSWFNTIKYTYVNLITLYAINTQRKRLENLLVQFYEKGIRAAAKHNENIPKVDEVMKVLPLDLLLDQDKICDFLETYRSQPGTTGYYYTQKLFDKYDNWRKPWSTITL